MVDGSKKKINIHQSNCCGERAEVAELVDAHDSNSCSKECGFDSRLRYKRQLDELLFLFYEWLRFIYFTQKNSIGFILEAVRILAIAWISIPIKILSEVLQPKQ